MAAGQYLSLFVYEDGPRVTANLRLSVRHADESEEMVYYPLDIPKVDDHTDLEDWCRQVLAAAVEII